MSSSAPSNGDQPSGRRRPEIEEWSNRLFIHPLAGVVARIAVRLDISPNSLSVTGLIAGIGAAACYWHWRDYAFVLAAFTLMILWHVMDGADGQVARMTGRFSEFGKLLDGVCDYLTFIAVYHVLWITSVPDFGAIAPIMGYSAGAFHVWQAALYERERTLYLSYMQTRQPTPQADLKGTWLAKVFGTAFQSYEAGQAIERHQREGLKNLTAGPEGKACYQRHLAPVLRWWGLVSANVRTLAIAVSCLAGNPLYYFAFEIVVLSAVVLTLKKATRAAEERCLSAVHEQA